jgi:PAS domain S-box-containing protein
MYSLLDRPEYEIVMARSGEEALERVLHDDFALILLDVAMPRMDGFEAAALIQQRERSRETPIIFITASVDDMDHIFRGYELGAVDYLRKPVDPHALRAKVDVFVRLYRQARRIAEQAAALDECRRRDLDASEQRFRLLWDSHLLPMVSWQLDGTFVDANDAFLELLGYTRTELKEGDLDWRSLLAPDTEGVEARAREELTQRGMFSTHERDFVSKQGKRVPVLFGGVFADADRRTVMGFAFDMTERRRNEIERTRLVHELSAAVAARDDFLSVAAHELKTPLTPLRMQISVLIRQHEKGRLDGERLGQSLVKLDKSGLRLDELVDELLDVSRLTAGRFQLTLEEFDLRELITGVLARIKELTDRAECPVTLHAAEKIRGRWDRTRIEQVVENLVVNAAKYGTGKPIEVTASGTQSAAIIEIADHGIGIPADKQASIFDKFERAAPDNHYGGFGLGLWIVRKIVEAHGGIIGVESVPDQGSRFTVQLPRVPLEELASSGLH